MCRGKPEKTVSDNHTPPSLSDDPCDDCSYWISYKLLKKGKK